jgi:hypothetical protein
LSLTAKVCCRRFPPRSSIPITVTLGRLNLGAIREQAPTQTVKAIICSSRGNMREMIPIFARLALALTLVAPWAEATLSAAATSGAPANAPTVTCLASGDGYLRAKMAGAVDANLDWPNSGTRCEGESRGKPPGVRLSFQRAAGAKPNLLLVFGLSGVTQGQSAREVKANLTVIVQGTSHIYGTLGDSRCTVDSLSQRPLNATGAYRIEARGFCTQPAHAVRGKGDVLVSTFEFAGLVNFTTEQI